MFRLLRTVFCCALAAACLLGPAPADARLVVHGKRVIYPEKSREITFYFRNKGDTPTLAQIWVDEFDKDEGPDASKAPFVALPPLIRVAAHTQQAARLRYTGAPLPDDRESVFWLNVLDAPPRDAAMDATQPYLQAAFRNKIKLFFRPAALKGLDASSSIGALQWSVVHEGKTQKLQARNDSPFHVNAVHAQLRVGDRWIEARNVGMIAPKSTLQFELPPVEAVPASAEVSFKYISEHGVLTEHSSALIHP